MKVKLIDFGSPYSAEFTDAITYTDHSGFNKIKWGGNREETLRDDVKPIVLQFKNRLGRTVKSLAYLKARDNFLSLNYDHFEVTGKLTNEQLTQIADYEAIDALNRYTSNKGATSWFSKIALILLIVGFIAGGYLIINYLTGGAIQLPKII